MGRTKKGTGTIGYNGPDEEKQLLNDIATAGDFRSYGAVVRHFIRIGIAEKFPEFLPRLEEIRRNHKEGVKDSYAKSLPVRAENIKKAHAVNKATVIADECALAKEFQKSLPVKRPKRGSALPALKDSEKGASNFQHSVQGLSPDESLPEGSKTTERAGRKREK